MHFILSTSFRVGFFRTYVVFIEKKTYSEVRIGPTDYISKFSKFFSILILSKKKKKLRNLKYKKMYVCTNG